jgi:tetraacyldisaccharide 4'-kinase
MLTPGFWVSDNAISRALIPASLAYGAIAAQRRDANPYRAPVPVICIGNATAGGSGKTPTAMAVAACARSRGIDVHFLSRGYGGNLKGPVRVDTERHLATDVGDEPLLLASVAPTWVARDRAAGAQAAVETGARLIVMDDGMQNPHIVKDVTLLVIDGAYGIGNGRIIPAGPLRQNFGEALAAATAVVIIGSDRTMITERVSGAKPVLSANLVAKPHDLAGCRSVAFAGIGRPEKFRETLLAEDVDIVGWFPFGDHHRYTKQEFENLVQRAETASARLVTTQKDYVRLPPEYRPNVGVLDVELVFGDATALSAILDRIGA